MNGQEETTEVGTGRLASDVVALTRSLVSVGMLAGHEAPVAEVVEAAMAERGYRDVHRDYLGNVVGFVGPKGGGTELLFDSHMDIVPAVGPWTVGPFDALVRDGRIYGRGTTDMKGALAASICGVAEAARHGRLIKEVAVSASVLEEQIEGMALGEVLDRLNPRAVVICEPSSMAINIGQRGRAEVLVTVSGVTAHAAHPQRGKNAILLAAQAIDAIEGMALSRDPVLGPAIMVPTDVVSRPYPSISALPDSLEIRYDRRLLPGETREGVLAELQQALDRIDPVAFKLEITSSPVTAYTGAVASPDRFLAPWMFDESLPLARTAVLALTQAGAAARFGSYGFCTNGSESAGRRGIPTIGLGPGAEADAHSVDESIGIDQLHLAVRAYRNLTLNIAGDAQ